MHRANDVRAWRDRHHSILCSWDAHEIADAVPSEDPDKIGLVNDGNRGAWRATVHAFGTFPSGVVEVSDRPSGCWCTSRATTLGHSLGIASFRVRLGPPPPLSRADRDEWAASGLLGSVACA